MSDATNETQDPSAYERAPFGTIDYLPEVMLHTDPNSPIGEAVLMQALEDVRKIWKRVEKRAPEAIKRSVQQRLDEAERHLLHVPEGDVSCVSVKDRTQVSKYLTDLQSELRGRLPWEPTFYRDGKLAVVYAQDPIKIRGAIDHVRIEQFFERYVRDAERAYERLQYFLEKAGLLTEDDKKKELKPWEQPYAQLDTYREMIWGRVRRPT